VSAVSTSLRRRVLVAQDGSEGHIPPVCLRPKDEAQKRTASILSRALRGDGLLLALLLAALDLWKNDGFDEVGPTSPVSLRLQVDALQLLLRDSDRESGGRFGIVHCVAYLIIG